MVSTFLSRYHNLQLRKRMERVVSYAGGGNFFTEVSNNNFFDDVDFSSMKDQIILHQDIINGDIVEDSIPLDDNAPLDVQNP